MNDQDRKPFAEHVIATLAMHNRKPSGAELEMWWEDLHAYPWEAVKRAFAQHRKGSDRPPTPSHILSHLPDLSGHLSPEEAWNRVPKTDSDGAYVTREMMQATSACEDSLERGDFIGARMAYLESYKKIVAEAKVIGERPRWFYSGPNDGDYTQRQYIHEAACIDAASRGWIGHDEAIQTLTGVALSLGKDPAQSIAQINGLPGSKVPRITHNPEGREKIRKIAQLLFSPDEKSKTDIQELLKNDDC